MSEPKLSRQVEQPLLQKQDNIPNPDEIALNIGMRNLKGFFSRRQITEPETQYHVEFHEQE